MSENPDQTNEKRTIKLTEKGMEEHKTRHIKARKYKLSQISGMINHLDELMKSNVNADLVKNKVRVDFHRLHQEFCEINAGLRKYMEEQDYVEDQKTWFEPKNKYINDYFWKCESWMKAVLMHETAEAQGAETPAPVAMDEVRSLRTAQMDNLSITSRARSRRSGSSRGSSSSSLRLKAEMERASLKVKAAALKEKMEIEREQAVILAQEKMKAAEFEAQQKRIEVEMKAKKEMHAIQTAMAEADAKMEVLQKYNSQHTQACLDFSSDGDDNEDAEDENNDIDGDQYQLELDQGTGAAGAQPVEMQQLLPPAGQDNNNRQGEMPPVLRPPTQHISLAPNHPNQTPPPSVIPPRASTALNVELSEGPAFDSLCKAINQQAHVTDYLVKNHKATLLPELKISTFSGDPLHYQTFIKSIEHSIEGRTSDATDRLHFLLQYTSAQPHELVKSCIHMEPTAGYMKAKSLLKEFFGDDFKIADAYMKEAMDWPTIKPEDGAALHSFALFLTGCSNAMTDISYLEDLDNTVNIKLLVSKLPYKLKETWRKFACDLQEKIKRRVKFKDFVEFITKQAKYMVHPLYGNIKDSNNSSHDTAHTAHPRFKSRTSDLQKSKKVFSTAVVDSSVENKDNKMSSENQKTYTPVDANSKPCAYCKGEHHSLVVCRKLKAKPHKEKIDFLRRKGLCFACLKHGHMGSSCKDKASCQECSGPHPTLLHMNIKPKEEQGPEQQTISSALVRTVEAYTHTGAGGEDCTLSIVPVCVKAVKGTKVITTYAFLDPGSTATFATESLIKELNMNGHNTSILLRTMGRESVVNTCIINGLEISSVDSEHFIQLSEVYSQKTIPVSKENIPRQEDVNSWPHLKEVKLPVIQANIGLLIGANVPKAMEPLQVIQSVDNGPYAVRTILGWTINGPLRGGGVSKTNAWTKVTVNRISVAKLDELWQLQFKQDFPDAGQCEDIEMSKDDHKFISMVSHSAELENGHYSVCLPVKNEKLHLPNNRSVAEQRALNLKKRFSRDEGYYKEYVAFMDGILEKGYAVEITNAEEQRPNDRIWYLPHHGVRHPVKQNLRVVFDCGASFGGTSLNQELLQGPDLTSSLVGVLLRFRQETVAMMADVEAMFYQVRVSDKDTDLLRFLWWPHGDYCQPLVEYKMLVHIFGATSSPSVATFAMQKCASDFGEEFGQEAAKTVFKNFYVDDCIRSIADDDSAVSLAAALIQMLAKGGFKLTKWSSNSRTLLNTIPANERASGFQNLDLDQDYLPVERALGVQWCTETDQFKFKVDIKDRPHTRRGLLSLVSSIYDPLGFLAPVILPAKRLLQELCRLKSGWDEELPDHIIKKWKRWLSDLKHLDGFGVNRCIKTKHFGPPVSAQLHHFADASEDAYGTASYVVLHNSKNVAQSALLMARARVAPLKMPTIPRLELTAATLAVKIDILLKKELELELKESVFWTDSTAVIKYLNSETTRFKTFVANRVTAILQHSQPCQWRYVNSTSNPADCVSRGLAADAFLRCEEWLSGPNFILQSPDLWPKNPDPTVLVCEDLEVKKVAQIHAVQVQPSNATDKLMLHFSSWIKLKRAVAWFLQLKVLLMNLRMKRKDMLTTSNDDNKMVSMTTVKGHDLTCSDLDEAESEIVKYIQMRYFEEDLMSLKEQNRVKRSSPLHKLNPMLQDGVMRVGGRLSRSAMPAEFKQPVILPKQSHVASLVLRHVHELTAHAGRNHMMAKLREKFWIPGAGGAIRKLLAKCITCRRLHGTAGKQLMADLPECRLLPDDPPFTRVGMDYFGPFLVQRGRTQAKR